MPAKIKRSSTSTMEQNREKPRKKPAETEGTTRDLHPDQWRRSMHVDLPGGLIRAQTPQILGRIEGGVSSGKKRINSTKDHKKRNGGPNVVSAQKTKPIIVRSSQKKKGTYMGRVGRFVKEGSWENL